jgi:hypothetical protein
MNVCLSPLTIGCELGATACDCPPYFGENTWSPIIQEGEMWH